MPAAQAPSQPNDEPDKAIDVAVALPVFSPFTYRVPEAFTDQVAVGKRALVPFGRRHITGYVLGPSERLPDVPLKPIKEVLDPQPLFPSCMVSFFQWISNYYIHPLGEVIQAALPSGINPAEQTVVSLTGHGRAALGERSLTAEETAVFELLIREDYRLSRLRKVAGSAFSSSLLSRWKHKGWVTQERRIFNATTRPKTVFFVYPGLETVTEKTLTQPRRRLLTYLSENGPTALADLGRDIPGAGSLAKAMARDGQVKIAPEKVYRDPFGGSIVPDHPPLLTGEQQAALDTMGPMLGQGFQTYLLSGVTGSGKTEIYLHLARMALDRQLSVLILVPEIALINQMERCFRARFGDLVAVLHSGLSNGERYDQWQRIIDGEASVIVGARSAIFAPLADVGLIIVDEEHDDSYKQEGALRYNARDLAVVRARQQGAIAVLGSATPSMQSAYNARNGKYQQVNLFERIDNRTLPEIIVEDLAAVREERGVRRFITPLLLEAMQDTLARKEQILLFLNRRGFAGTLVCAVCGAPMRCDRCDISLTYHQKTNAYKCHYCGFSRPSVSPCSNCGSPRIKRLGLGTEKLETQIRSLFPTARVARMDRDTTSRKGALLKILKDLRDGRIDILIGTQMVAKGHDFPNITLVGIICADLSLSLPDFRAGERTFQILAQVAGRSGRGRSPGRVVLQTYNPDHFSIEAARHQDYDAFYRQEIAFRKALQYPPVTRMIQLRITGNDKDATSHRADALGARCRELAHTQKLFAAIQILGPAEAPLHRIADQFRWQILLKGRRTDLLHQLVGQLLFGSENEIKTGGCKIHIDVDPVFLM